MTVDNRRVRTDPTSAGHRPVRAVLGDVTVDVVGFDAAVDLIAKPAVTPARTITTLNLQQLALAHRDPTIAELIRRSDLTVADGWPVAALAGWQANQRCPRVTGSDLLPSLLARAGECGLSVALIGARHGASAELMAAHLRRFPSAQVRALEPDISDSPDERDVCQLAPLLDGGAFDLILLALGSPKSDRLAGLLAESLRGGTIVGVGAAVDFLTGRIARAPRSWQVLGMEWLWRLAHEPRRLGPRYFRAATAFVPVAVATAWRGRQRREQAPIAGRDEPWRR